MAEKRYFWLKLKNDYFSTNRMKKIRRCRGGEIYTLILMKLQLFSIESSGIIRFQRLENSFIEELALDIDEDVGDVKPAVSQIITLGLANYGETEDELIFPYVIENLGSEGSSAKRMRNMRLKDVQDEAFPSHCDAPSSLYDTPDLRCDALSSHCDAQPLHCDAQPSHCDAQPSHCDIPVTEIQSKIQNQNRYISIDKAREISDTEQPSLEDVRMFCYEKHLTDIDPFYFFNYYNSLNWIINGKPIKNWKGLCITWSKKGENTHAENNRNVNQEHSEYCATIL